MSKIKLFVLISVLIIIFLLAVFASPRLINPLGSDVEKEIFISIRLPRAFVAILMGIALGAAGAILQGVLRNPLADPYILGISSSASLFAALGLLTGLYTFGRFTIPLTAFIGALVVSMIVGALGWKGNRLWPDRLLLAGIGISFLCHALLMLLMSVSSDEGLRRAVLWIFGDLSMADWSLISYGILLISAGLILSLSRAKALNALILGDEFAHSLGFSVSKERLLFFIAIALMTAASVSMGGTIGFIGLLVPHIMRNFFGADSRVLIPASAIAGGAFLCFSDLIGRSIMPPSEIPSGIITALIGSPYFLYLLRRKDVLSV
ncbi:MAG: iron ABC transporter permease [Nitrospiraceae bacterium]|nr:iron ABC transporter permease [Nitrospiraceae bacterium]